MKNRWTLYLLTATACCWGFAGQSAHAQVVINEVLQNPEGSNDEFWEYIELYGRPGFDLTGYAICLMNGGIDGNNDGMIGPGDTVPEIDEAFSLDGLSIGANGFFVLYNDTGGASNLVSLALIDAGANSAGFTATHIPTIDTPGKLSNDGSSTYVLVRKRPDHSLDMSNMSVYGPGYAFRKDVRHDVNGDGIVDIGTETNTIGTGDVAMTVDPYQVVDEFCWSNAGGLEYTRSRQQEISDTPGFNPDMVSRLAYYCTNPFRGYRTVGPIAGPFTIENTSIADESFVYGEMITSFPLDADFFKYATAIDVMTGFTRATGPTDASAMPFDGACDPEPDDAPAVGCSPVADGVFYFTNVDVTDFVLTPGTFNDHPTPGTLDQFRFLRGDFNVDGVVNHLDERLIRDRIGRTLDETEIGTGNYLAQGAEFQKILMMLEMDMADTVTVDQNDLDAFLAECTACGVASNAEIRITEYMYTGNGDEFVELTNLGAVAVDMTGWSLGDNGQISGVFDLSGFGTVAPGESVIITQDDAAYFKLDWGIPAVKVIGHLGDVVGENYGRNDEINVYDGGGLLVDRLTYNDQTIAGSPRTQRASAWPCQNAVGANDASMWRLSLAGTDTLMDPQGSYVSANGDTGNPGTFILDDCSAPPLPTGACCRIGVCTDVNDAPYATQGYCEATGGFYQGDGSTCAMVAPCPPQSNAVIRITEYMYSGGGGEFVELTNLDAVAVDMTDWRLNDSAGIPASGFDLSAFGMVQPGESVIVTQDTEAVFRTAWSLDPSVKIVGELGVVSGNNYGRNDEINLFDASGDLVDQLTYGDQDFPGTIRTNAVSGRPCATAVGANAIANWVLSANGDTNGGYASTNGDIGSPGTYVSDVCTIDPVGACCLADGSCVESSTQTQCDDLSGDWAGVDVTCVSAECPQPSDQQMRITEYLYSGLASLPEFVEFTNVGVTPIDMTGWSYDDNSRLPDIFDLSAFGMVLPGESVLIAEDTEVNFRANWSIPATVKVLGSYTNNLGGSDEINLFDANDQLVDRLTYSDSGFPGSIRANEFSGWVCTEGLGANDIYRWTLSSTGDIQSSYASSAGDVGSPGTHVAVPCPMGCTTCPADVDGDGSITMNDVDDFVGCALGSTPVEDCDCADTDSSGVVDGADVQSFTATVIGAPGACP